MDMNERALRSIVSSLGGAANGFPREDGFDITVASEVMAIFCLARDLQDLKQRLGNIVVGYTRERKPVRAGDLKAQGAMTVLLKDALAPNLVQTLEDKPAFIHGGPFANIAHGCNSVLATTTALKLADYVVTEAGFGADLGAEKFIDIKCRKAGLAPDCVVLVATIRALKMHGGVKKEDSRRRTSRRSKPAWPISSVMSRTCRNSASCRWSPSTTSPPTPRPRSSWSRRLRQAGRRARDGGSLGGGRRGCGRRRARGGQDRRERQEQLKFLYPDDMPLLDKIRTIAKKIYGAEDIEADESVRDQLAAFEERATANSRSASPRRSTASRPIPMPRARPPVTSSTCARCGSRPAPSSSWRSAVTS